MYFKISIITVVKNDPKGIEKTINSVKTQLARSDIEFIIIDGASNDDTIKIIKKYQDDIQIWISESDQGLYYAMNKGLNLANGDHILFMNSGDVFSNYSVIKLVLGNIRENNSIYYGNTKICIEETSFTRKPTTNQILNTNYLPHHQSIFYPKCFYKKYQYDTKFSVSADAHFTKLAMKLNKSTYLNFDIINSILGGFGIKQYSTILGIFKMIDESIVGEKEYNSISLIKKISIYTEHFLKYTSIKFFGFKGIIYLMKMNQSFKLKNE